MGPLELARALLEKAKTAPDPTPLIDAARALLEEAGRAPVEDPATGTEG